MKSSRRKGDTYIPNDPFVAWLRHEIRALGEDPDQASYDTFRGTRAREELSARLNITPRTLYRHLRRLSGSSKPTAEISRIGVEEMLHHAGTSFYDLYPEFEHEREIELEPDAWCRCCAEYVTPIDAVCPWCDTPVDRLDVAA